MSCFSINAVHAADGHGELVLIVEDDPAVRVSTSRILREHGYRTIEAEDGRSALDHGRDLAEDIDLVLTDVVMPGMGGGDPAEHLAKRYPRLRTLFMTGYPERAGEGRRPLSKSEVIEKPFMPAELLDRVDRMLKE
jgi:CheY-like chemotaxis protein